MVVGFPSGISGFAWTRAYFIILLPLMRGGGAALFVILFLAGLVLGSAGFVKYGDRGEGCPDFVGYVTMYHRLGAGPFRSSEGESVLCPSGFWRHHQSSGPLGWSQPESDLHLCPPRLSLL